MKSLIRSTRRLGVPALLACVTGLAGTTAPAQQTALDPYKPYNRNYLPFSDPGASLRPGFPNPIGAGRPTYGNFNPTDTLYGGFDPFGAPYFNRRINLDLNRAASTYERSVGDYARQPGNPIDPQELADREFYKMQAEKADPYQKLERQREEFYFKALAEKDPKKRAELLKEYQKASARTARAYSSSRRQPASTSPSGRTIGPTVGPRRRTSPAEEAGPDLTPADAPVAAPRTPPRR